MKAVFSLLSTLDSYSRFYKNKNLLVEMLMVSSHLAQKSGFKTCLVYDEFFDLPSDCGKVFDEIKIIPKEEIYNMKLPNIAGRTISKLLCLKSINEPFIYLDPGVILYKEKIKQVLEKQKDCFVYHDLDGNDDFKDEIVKQSSMLGLDISSFVANQVFSSTEIIGGSNYMLINNASSRLLEFIINNGAYLEKELLENKLFNEKLICDRLIDLDDIINNYWLPSFLYSETGLEVSNLVIFGNELTSNAVRSIIELEAGVETGSLNNSDSKNVNSVHRKMIKRVFNYKTGIMSINPFQDGDAEILKKIKEKILNTSQAVS
jgi:hypothetical protein